MLRQKVEIDLPADATNLVQAFLRHQRSAPAALHKVQGEWKSVTWGTIIQRVGALSESLVSLGVEPGDRVCIWAQTSLEWCLVDLAILSAGAVTVPIYASNTAQETEHIIADCQARVVFVDHEPPEKRSNGRYFRLLDIRSRASCIKQIIWIICFGMGSDASFGSDSRQRQADVLDMDELERRGQALVDANPTGLTSRARKIVGDDLSCILYTSGTAGKPKGVMLTHANWVAQSYSTLQSTILNQGDTILLFLPLAHSFARLAQMCWVVQEATLAFAESIENVVANAAQVRPTLLPSVPRVFEKAYSQILAEGFSKHGLQGRIFRWAMVWFEKYVAHREAEKPFHSLRWFLAKRLVFTAIGRKMRAKFGGRIRAFISGGAPLLRKIGYFFDACGLNILEGYGLTETCAPTHANRVGANYIGTVGAPFPGIETKIAPDGEILVRGPQIMKGYYHLPAETKQVLDGDGWLSTGDIGEIDAQGMLRITDRKKDLFKTSGGKYIAPQELENALKADSLINQVSVHGGGRKYATALLTVSHEKAIDWARQHQVDQGDLTQICRHPLFRARLQQSVDALNATLPSYATIKKFAILDDDWSQDTGELTPTLKVKRAVVEQRYRAVIDGLYQESAE